MYFFYTNNLINEFSQKQQHLVTFFSFIAAEKQLIQLYLYSDRPKASIRGVSFSWDFSATKQILRRELECVREGEILTVIGVPGTSMRCSSGFLHRWNFGG